MADTEWVLMEHPKLKDTKDNPVRVPKTAYDEVWSDRGWTIKKGGDA